MSWAFLLWLSVEPQRCAVERAVADISSPFVVEVRDGKPMRIPIDWESYERLPEFSHHPIERLIAPSVD